MGQPPHSYGCARARRWSAVAICASIVFAAGHLAVDAADTGNAPAKNYCNIGQGMYYCSNACSGYYYCSGPQAGNIHTCPTGTVCRGMGGFPLYKSGVGGDWPSRTACVPTANAPATCFGAAAAAAPTPCQRASCSGHGTCGGAGRADDGVCACDQGWSNAPNRTGAALRTQCSEPANPLDSLGACRTKLELALLLDASGSVNQLDYEKEIAFGKRFLGNFVLGAGYTRVSVTQFATDVQPVGAPLASDATSVGNNLDEPPKERGTTNIAGALTTTQQQFDAGARPGVRRIALLVTDGDDTVQGPAAAQAAATAVKAKGTRVVVVAVGSNLAEAEMRKMATDAATDYFHVDNFAALMGLVRALREELCIGIEGAAPLRQCLAGGKEVIVRGRGFGLTAQQGKNLACQFGDGTGDGLKPVVVPAKWNGYTELACVAPPFAQVYDAKNQPAEKKQADADRETFRVNVRVSLDGGTTYLNANDPFVLVYERCYDHPWWLILLLLFLLLSLLSFSCCIVVRKQSAHDVPEAMYVQELEAPRPIEKPVVPAPAPRPAPKKPRKQPKPKKATKKKKPKKKPKNQKPRKWRTVATGHYIGSQGPMAVKWGKLGEVNTGERVVVGEEDSSSSESEQSSSDESVLSSSDESQHDSSDDEVDLPPLPALEIERPEQVSKQKIVEQRRCRCNTWQWLILAILLAAIVGTAIAIVVDENKRDSLDGDGTTESSRMRQLGTQLHALLRGSGRGGEE